MAEISIVNRMAAFIEHVENSTGVRPANIVISKDQLKELQAETDTDQSIRAREESQRRGEEQKYSFWGTPLIVMEGDDGKTTIESH